MNVLHLEHDLFLLLLNLSQITGEERIKTLFVDSMNSLSEHLQLCFVEKQEDALGEAIEIASIKNHLGFIDMQSDPDQIDESAKALIRNSVKMLALFLEKQLNDRLLSDEKLLLNDLVTKQTLNLEIANEELKKEIEERKSLTQKLEESKFFIQRILDTTPNLIYIFDLLEQKNIFANQEITKFLGYSKQNIQALGSNIMEQIIHPEDMPSVLKQHEAMRTIPDNQMCELSYRVKHTDGSWRWLCSRELPFSRSSDGNVKRILGIAEDVTEKKESEKIKLKLEEQLRQAQKMESVGRLAGGVAHDFNNMLSVILGRTEMALEEMDPSHPLYFDLKEILDAAMRSADVTRQLLAFARKQTIAPKVIDLNKTVKGILKMLYRLIGEDIELIWLPGEELWPVKMDPSQIDQILANLSVNAKDAIADGGKLIIETSKAAFDQEYCTDHPGFLPGEFVQLTFSDNGCGMERETVKEIFEPFFTTKDVDRGTGLGLATVYGIVKQNEGFIDVYSEPNKGTTFKLYLPRYKSAQEKAHLNSQTKIGAEGKETILLVEDETSILEMTAQMLKRLCYTVITATTPGEAISVVREYDGDIHLLITDVVMPEMNGRDLAKNLLSMCPNLNRLFMSGYTADVIAHHGVLDDGVNFIQKPFSKQDLSAKVREVLDSEKDRN